MADDLALAPPADDRLREVLYKVTALDGSSVHGGTGTWPLPTQDRLGRWRPGRWWRVDGDLAPCQWGLHLVTAAHVGGWVRWLDGFAVWEAQVEPGAAVVGHTDKVVVASARLRRPVLIADMAWIEAYQRQPPPILEGVRRIGQPPATDWSLASMLAFDPTAVPDPEPERLVFGLHYMEDRLARQAPYAQSCTAARLWSRTKRRMDRLLGPMPPEQYAWVKGLQVLGG